MNIAELKELALHSARGTAPATFSAENVNAAFTDGLKELASNYYEFMENRYTIYSILTETVDDIVPNKVIDAVGIFAEVRTAKQGEKVLFKTKLGKQRAKKFLTRVGLSGVYETFRLDYDYLELSSFTYGGAGIIDFERYLDGLEDIADIYEVILDGMVTAIFKEIQGCLNSVWEGLGHLSRNRQRSNVFDGQKMAELIQVVKAYGNPVIYCSPQFASMMINVIATPDEKYHVGEQDLNDVREYGYVGKFAGTPVVVIPNSFEDESNEKLVFDPRFAYVIPAGKEKIIKVALVGQTIIDEWKNTDRSMEIQGYKKIGVGLVSAPNYWGIYLNDGIDAWGHGDIAE